MIGSCLKPSRRLDRDLLHLPFLAPTRVAAWQASDRGGPDGAAVGARLSAPHPQARRAGEGATAQINHVTWLYGSTAVDPVETMSRL